MGSCWLVDSAGPALSSRSFDWSVVQMNEGLVTAAVADLKAQGYEGGKADDGSVRLSRDKTTVTVQSPRSRPSLSSTVSQPQANTFFKT